MPPFLPFFIVGLVLAAVGWGGLVVLIMVTLPTLGPRWLFFFLLSLALSGTTLPLIHFLHRRFPSNPPAGAGVIMREAVLVAFYGGLLAWLQLGRVLTSAMAAFIAMGLVAIEFFIRLNERSRFKPKEDSENE